jgi:hypothetical protein
MNKSSMNKSKIIKAQLLLFFVTISMCTKAQDSSFVSAVTSKRGILDTKIFHLGSKIKQKEVLGLYTNENAKKSIQLYKKSKYFLPAGPPLVLGGIYLGYDAIKGTKMQTEIDGKLYTYYVRPIEQLLGGIAIFAVGVCMIEYANEFKSKSVDLFNEKLKNKGKSKELDLKIGYTPSRNFGLYANF